MSSCPSLPRSLAAAHPDTGGRDTPKAYLFTCVLKCLCLVLPSVCPRVSGSRATGAGVDVLGQGERECLPGSLLFLFSTPVRSSSAASSSSSSSSLRLSAPLHASSGRSFVSSQCPSHFPRINCCHVTHHPVLYIRRSELLSTWVTETKDVASVKL